MNVSLSMELSKDLMNRLPLINSISDDLKLFFVNRNYGEGVETITIGVLCVSPDFEFFFKKRKRYQEDNGLLEYDVKLDYNEIKNYDDIELRCHIFKKIKFSFQDIDGLRIEKFDLEAFIDDFNKISCV